MPQLERTVRKGECRVWTIDSLLAKTKKVGDCLMWQGWKNTDGYGIVSHNKKLWSASRLIKSLTDRIIPPKNLFACHHCDTPGCLNPDHIFWGTAKDNAQDLSRKGLTLNQKKTHCSNGHPFNAENTYVYANGRRNCRVCNLASFHRRKK